MILESYCMAFFPAPKCCFICISICLCWPAKIHCCDIHQLISVVHLNVVIMECYQQIDEKLVQHLSKNKYTSFALIWTSIASICCRWRILVIVKQLIQINWGMPQQIYMVRNKTTSCHPAKNSHCHFYYIHQQPAPKIMMYHRSG